ncbi:hypothetical protein B0J14DRAFT_586477 [Halenospora varia]|nr:hypothetical protein B0J14DRAFT_586477 [Halenospora varia]
MDNGQGISALDDVSKEMATARNGSGLATKLPPPAIYCIMMGLAVAICSSTCIMLSHESMSFGAALCFAVLFKFLREERLFSDKAFALMSQNTLLGVLSTELERIVEEPQQRIFEYQQPPRVPLGFWELDSDLVQKQATYIQTLKREIELMRPLYQVGFHTRRRFLEKLKGFLPGFVLLEQNPIIIKGNREAHDGNYVADFSLLHSKTLSQTDRAEVMSLFEKLYGYLDRAPDRSTLKQ